MAGLKFRVLLDTEQNQEIFRDILVGQNHSFEAFYQEIMRSFQFEGNQMASFYVSNDDWDKGHEISWMDMSYGEDDEQETDRPSVMNTTLLKELVEDPDQKFILVYDFMRMWIFLIELIGHEQEEPAEPTCILSVGNAPAEDSKQMSTESFQSEFDDDDEDFGFNDFDDGMDEEDMNNMDQYDY